MNAEKLAKVMFLCGQMVDPAKSNQLYAIMQMIDSVMEDANLQEMTKI